LEELVLYGNDALSQEQVDALQAQLPDCYIDNFYTYA